MEASAWLPGDVMGTLAQVDFLWSKASFWETLDIDSAGLGLGLTTGV